MVRVSTANPSQMPARAARRGVVDVTNSAANAMSSVVISAASVGSGECRTSNG